VVSSNTACDVKYIPLMKVVPTAVMRKEARLAMQRLRRRDALRATRAAQPAAGGSGGEAASLGKPGEALTFESLARAKGAQVRFLCRCARDASADVISSSGTGCDGQLTPGWSITRSTCRHDL